MTACLKTVSTFICTVQLRVIGKRGTKLISLKLALTLFGKWLCDQLGTTCSYDRKMIISCAHIRKATYFMSVGTKPRPCFSIHSDARKMFYFKVKLQNTICGNPPLLLPFILPSTPTIPDAQRPPKNPPTKRSTQNEQGFPFGPQAAP